jgi:carboxyl-terminal processing protease
MPRRNLLILLLATVVSYACYVRGEQNPYARYAGESLATIRNSALDEVPARELFDGAMRGMVDVLRSRGDSHSEFLDEKHADPLRTEIRQQFGGIGVRIGFVGSPPRLTIIAPPDADTPAARANLAVGDVILSISGRLTADLSMNDVLRLVRGEPGSKVGLVVQAQSASQPRTVELIREVINIESILGDRRRKDGGWEFRLAADPRIAHIRITSFGDRTAAEFAKVLASVTSSGAQGAVIDLRDNPGGALDAAVAICEMLLPKDVTIVETRGRGQTLRHRYTTARNGRYLDLPLAVIVNGNTASAAEIMAACLQDYRRAAVVGERTFGKGSVQQLLPLESGKSLLKLTWASFWRPSGANIQRPANAANDATWGVSPDPGLEQKLTADEYAQYQEYRTNRDGEGIDKRPDKELANGIESQSAFVDKQLAAALKNLQTKLESSLQSATTTNTQ